MKSDSAGSDTQTSIENMKRLAISLLIGLLIILGGFSWHSWQLEKSYRTKELSGVLEFGAQFVDGYLERMELRLRMLRRDMLKNGPQISYQQAMEEFNRFLRNDTINLMLIKADGELVAGLDIDLPPGRALPSFASDRSFLKVREELRRGKVLAIAEPKDSVVYDVQVLHLRYPIRNADGELTHIIGVDLRLGMLQDFWKTALVSQETVLGLMLDDGKLLNVYHSIPGFQLEEGSGLSGAGDLIAYLEKTAFPASGQLESQRKKDGAKQLSVFRRLANYPANIFISIPMSTIKTGWWQRVQMPFFLSFILLVCGTLAYRQALKNTRTRAHEQSLARELLRISNERWKLALEFAGDGMWELDFQTGTLEFSRPSLDMLGYADGELENSREQWINLAPPEDRLRMSAAIEAYATGETQDFKIEFRSVCKDGTSKWFLARGNALTRDSQGKPLHVLGTLNDITLRKMAQQQLEASEERLRQGFILYPTGVAVVSEQDAVLEANPALCRMFGYAESELIGAPLEQLFVDRRSSDGLIQTELSAGESVSNVLLERMAIHKDGHRFPVVFIVSLIRQANDDRFNLVVRIEDLSERKRAQLQDIANGVLVAQEQDRARISHELHDEIGQSLTALKLSLRRAQQSLADPDKAESCLVNGQQILEILMVEVRNIAYRLRPAEIDQLGLVAALHSHLDKTFRPLGQDVALTENFGDSRFSPDLELCCFRVVQEALTNSLRHAQASVYEVSLTRDSARLVLSVRDDGAGFDLSQYSSSLGGSRSLGLVGMRERVSANGGQLQIRSVPGRGTEVIATFDLSGEIR